MIRWLACVVGLICVTALSGCGTLNYYSQAIAGHFELMRKTQSIEAVLADPSTSAELRRKLALVDQVRRFATERLHLPDNDSYRKYADLGRPYVVWNVFAAPELSLEPVESCFVFVGCLSYRGFFDEAEAENFARTLKEAGNDVFVGGVAAYSTLGWFDDPVLNTMLVWEDERIINVIFHELAHQQLYASDDSVFNESFATAVAEFGVARWFEHTQSKPANYVVDSRRDQAFYALLLSYRDKLEGLYASNEPVSTMRERKAIFYSELQAEYAALKLSWSGYNGYDDWMMRDLNNAKLASVATYHDYVPGFRSILEETDNDLTEFYVIVERLAALPKAQRDQCLSIASGPKSLALTEVCGDVFDGN